MVLNCLEICSNSSKKLKTTIYISNILLLLVTVFFVDNLGVFINNYLILF